MFLVRLILIFTLSCPNMFVKPLPLIVRVNQGAFVELFALCLRLWLWLVNYFLYPHPTPKNLMVCGANC